MKSAELDFFAATRRFEMSAGALPDLSSIARAYEIQNQICSRDETPIAWKLGGVTEATRLAFNVSNVYAGPISSAGIFPVASQMSAQQFGIQCQGEPELVVELSELIFDNSVPGERLISKIAPGIECPASVLSFPDSGIEALIADGCAAGSLVYGKWKPWLSFNESKRNGEVVMSADNEVLSRGCYGNLIDGLLATVRAFLNLARDYDLPVRPNDLVSTGGLAPCVQLPVGKPINVSFNSFEPFGFEIVA